MLFVNSITYDTYVYFTSLLWLNSAYVSPKPTEQSV